MPPYLSTCRWSRRVAPSGWAARCYRSQRSKSRGAAGGRSDPGGWAYDSDPLRERLARQGTELIAPHRFNRSKPPTQDGRGLHRYRRRWIIERTIAWLGNFRRLVVHYDRSLTIYRTS